MVLAEPTNINDPALDELRSRMQGRLIQPGDADYARLSQRNAVEQAAPVGIVQCADADVGRSRRRTVGAAL